MTKKNIISNYYIITGIAIITILVLGSIFLSVTTYGLNKISITKKGYFGNNIENSMNDSNNAATTNNNTKAVVVAFDDAWKSQFTYAKPILDKFGFKGSFFIVCNYVGKSPDRMTWNDIQTLERQGHDIESHSMNHIRLDDLSQQQLNYEIGQSKQCIIDHALVSNNTSNNNVSIFAYPYDIGHTNITVINTVAEYYQLGRTGDKPLAFLNCNLALEDKRGRINETDYFNGNCNKTHIITGLFFDKNNNKESNLINAMYYDTLLKADRYSIRSWTHHAHSNTNNLYNDTQMFEQFVQEVNSQDKYNGEGTINAIPIITYHNFTNTLNMDYSRNEYNTDVNLFSREMKYLYNHHFIVLPMSDIRYNRNTGDLYLTRLDQ